MAAQQSRGDDKPVRIVVTAKTFVYLMHFSPLRSFSLCGGHDLVPDPRNPPLAPRLPSQDTAGLRASLLSDTRCQLILCCSSPTTILQGAQFSGRCSLEPLSKHCGCHLLWGCHTNNLRLPILLKRANTKFTATSAFHVNTAVIKFR